MRQLIAVALFCAGLFCIAQAQVPMTGAGLGAPSSGGGGFTGPGDCSGCASSANAVAWWGLRAFSAADRGNKLANVCDSLLTHCTDFLSDATTGNLVFQLLPGGHDCTADDCLIKTLYDRSGALDCSSAACDIGNGVLGQNPSLKHNCIGTLPCLVFASGNNLGTSANPATHNQPFSLSAACKTTSGGSFQDCIANNSPIQQGFSNSASTLLQDAGSVVTITGYTDGSFHSMQAVYNGASSSTYADGTSNATSPGTNGISNSNAYTISTPNQLIGQWLEGGYWKTGFTSGQQSSLDTNQHSYWGF